MLSGHQSNLVLALAFTICTYYKWINIVGIVIFQINKVAKKWAEEVLARFKGGNPHSQDKKYGENIAIRTFRAGWEAVPDVSMSTEKCF